MAEVLIVMGSKSDSEIAEKAAKVLHKLGVSFKIEVASAHREPEKVKKLALKSDSQVFIAVAGLSAALPGAIAAYTHKPVIGVPVNVKLQGLDALLAMMQTPSGTPVATVGVDNGKNAALLAARILAITDKRLEKKILQYLDKVG